MKKLSVILLLILTGCATSVYNLSQEEQEGLTFQVFEYPYEDVFTATLQQIQTGQSMVDMADREAGIINTDWLQDDSALRQILIGGQRARMSINITKLDESRTRVFLRLYAQSRGSFGSWDEVAVTAAVAEEHIPEFFSNVLSRLQE